jgi:hypothetical protein
MTDQPPALRPHLWVPYGLADAEICTLCGEFMNPDNADEDCPETFPEIEDDPPPEMPAAGDDAEPPDGSDDEQRHGAITPP